MSLDRKYKNVVAGQPLAPSAEAWNALLRLLRKDNTSKRFGLTRDPGAISRHPGTVLIKNNASDIDRFGVLGIDDVAITPTENADGFKEGAAFLGILPADTHAGKFVVAVDPIPFGEYGRAVVSGLTICQISVVKQWHPRADVLAGDTAKLVSGLTGAATILWKETGTGTKWAVVKIGNRYETVFPARVHEYTLTGTNQWTYTLIEQELSADGYGGWADKSGGRTVTAYNSIENPNDGTGIEGNGAELEPGEVLMPAGLDAIVYCEERLYGSAVTPSKSYWFAFENEVANTIGSSGSASGGSAGEGTIYQDLRALKSRTCVNDGICQWEVFTFETWRHRARTMPVRVQVEVEQGCRVPFCDESGMHSGDAPSAYLDQWLPCDQPSGEALWLPEWVFDSIPLDFDNPVIKVNATGNCYQLNASHVTGQTPTFTEPFVFAVYESCDDSNCPVAPCDPSCQQAPTNSPTADLTDQGCPGTEPNDTAFNPTSFAATGGPGGTPLWMWTGTVNAAILRIYCDGGTMYARLSNAAGTAHFGSVGGPSVGYRDITASVNCAGGQLQGTFTLVNTANFCDGGDVGTRQIIITL